jgi:hypothetical protein
MRQWSSALCSQSKKLKGSSIIPVSSTQGLPQPPIHQKEIDKVAELLWEIKMGGRWIYQNIYVVPELSSIFYTDGTSCIFSAMRIRRLDIESGKEICTFPIRSFVNNLCFSENFSQVYANTDKRIISMSSLSLQQIERWDSRVPSAMTYSILFDRIVAMKGLHSGSSVNLYNLDTSTVKRIKVGEGGPILRDTKENHLICCSDNRTVYRIEVTTGKADLLASGLSFDDAAVVYEKNTLWLCRGTERLLSTYPYPPLVLLALPLQGKHEAQRHELNMQCKKFSITNDGNYVWIDLHHLVVPRQADKSCLLKNVENSVGVKSPSDPCGLTSL